MMHLHIYYFQFDIYFLNAEKKNIEITIIKLTN